MTVHPRSNGTGCTFKTASYIKVRQKERVVSVAVTIAAAVNTDGRREVLGMNIDSSEPETFWLEFLRKLKRRDLAGVKLVISGAQGIKAAVSKVFRATWQRCRVHLTSPRLRASCATSRPMRARADDW